MDHFKYSSFMYLLILMFTTLNASHDEERALLGNIYNGINEFARDFYSDCAKIASDNILYSPMSIVNSLGLLQQASTGNTFDPLEHGLDLDKDKMVVANQFLTERETIEKSAGNATLLIINQMYIQQGPRFNPRFQDVAVSKFKSDIVALNFAESEKSAQTINDFVEASTNGKIKDLISPDQLQSDTQSVLVNAVYFKGELRFEEEKTQKRKFYISNTEKVDADFMSGNGCFNLVTFDDLNATALEMKYANSNFSFVIILPFSRTGLTELESKLKWRHFYKITQSTQCESNVDIHIPKFKIKHEINMNHALEKSGMEKMFSDDGHLNGMLETGESVKISNFIHKTVVEISEEGSDPRAEDPVLVTHSTPKQFNVNHPFMFYIRDVRVDTIVISGRVVKL